MLVSHSSAIYPSTLLWRDEQGPSIKSITFISPAGHRRIKAMRPKIVTSVFVRVYQNKLGRQVCRTFGTKVLSITGCPVRPDNMDTVILSATTMVYSKFRKLQESLEMLREKEVPILFILSENDKLVDTEISYEMAGILGAKDANYSIYKNTVCEKKRTCTRYPWVVALSGGGHYSFINYPQVVNGEILQFLDSVNHDRSHHVDRNENVKEDKSCQVIEVCGDDVQELPQKVGHNDVIELRQVAVN